MAWLELPGAAGPGGMSAVVLGAAAVLETLRGAGRRGAVPGGTGGTARRWAVPGGTARRWAVPRVAGRYRASLGDAGRCSASLGGAGRYCVVWAASRVAGRCRAVPGGRAEQPLVGQRMLAQAVVVAASACPARVGARGAALGGDWRRAAVRSSPWCCLALLGRPSRGALGGGCSPERWVWQPRAAGRAVAAAAAAGVGWVGGCCCWQGRAAVAAAVAIWVLDRCGPLDQGDLTVEDGREGRESSNVSGQCVCSQIGWILRSSVANV
ncbi:spidroin-1-like [Selaginella moellendorffii]|uniref:spidroin-1-like n=1 Tax=Selaginella moellendorffii TaxID=88036 RepID=UPI000D1CBB89|nr:spidroin-1-like [Selaginella moellendorffii]|eukprot:XP_024518828.1 spidroin-1-like [Selaginella moellendorffii]